MKTMLFSIFVMLSMTAKAQYVTIPDTNFRNKLIQLLPACFNAGQQMDTNCSGVVNTLDLDIINNNISNLDGIQYFDNLQTLLCANNPITNLANLPLQLKMLDCRTCSLSIFPILPNNLEELNCSYNPFTTIQGLPLNLKKITCYSINLVSINSFPNSIEYIDCHNSLTSIPALPTSLKELYWEGTLTSLPNLPNTLIHLECFNNSLTALPPLPQSLYYLDVSNNQLSSLPALPDDLALLYCDHNLLSSLPLPDSLHYLNCYNNLLTSLPPLPYTLNGLGCQDNQLTSLPQLPISLFDLNCQNNKLSSIPNIPPYLNILRCSNNKIKSLPKIEGNLEDLYCNNNLLTSLPALPNSMDELICNNNQLTSLPSLPVQLHQLNFSNNRLLDCLPLLPNSLTSLTWYATSITCLPNYPNGVTYGLPLCGASCEPRPTLGGLVFLDNNNNGQYNASTDVLLKDQIVSGTYGWKSTTSEGGEYIVKLDSAKVNTITLSPTFHYCTFTPANHVITPTSSGSQGSGYNFAVQLTPNIQDVSVSIVKGPARPGFNQGVTATLNNDGTTAIQNITLKMVKPSSFVNLNANPAISAQIGDTLIWNNINLNLFENKNFNISWAVPVTDSLGTPYHIEAQVLSVTNDPTPSNNFIADNGVIVGSFDPNDKNVDKENMVNESGNNELRYTIRFQNTGTDTAFTVVVRDTLSSKLDISTFRMLGSSHNYSVKIRDQGILEVFFQNILLVDSFTNEPASHGFFQYSIKPKANVAVGESIENTAYIYFDFNTPVVTNTTHTKTIAGNLLFLSNIYIYPNPNFDKITVRMPELSGTLTISDLNGRKLKTVQVKNGTEIDMSSLPNGIYIGKIETGNGFKSLKIVKQK